MFWGVMEVWVFLCVCGGGVSCCFLVCFKNTKSVIFYYDVQK